MKPAPQYPMAVDRVRWHGEPVVMVVAETRALAEDACELVAIDWEELPVVAHKETALEPGTLARCIPNSATTWRSARWSTPAAWTRSSRRPTWWSRARSASGGTPP